MDKLAVPEEILCIAKKLKEAQASLFLVGGSVRDLLLGIEPEEYDFEIFADPDLRKSFLQMEANHREQLVASFTSDVTSILAKVSEIKEVGKSFGVYKMKDKPYDFSFPRAEKKTGESRREYDVIINPFLDVSLAQKRRDLTINSLLYCPLTGQLIDHFGGLDDLKNGLLRHVDADTFTEDPLRVYRIAQFVARFGFSVDAQTLAISRQVNFNRLSLERIDAEWRKMIEASHVDQGLYFLYHADVLKKKHPEMELIINKNKDKVLSAGWFSPLTEVSAYEKKMVLFLWLLQEEITEQMISLSEAVVRGITNNKDFIRKVLSYLDTLGQFEKYYARSQTVEDTVANTYKKKDTLDKKLIVIHEQLYRRKFNQSYTEGTDLWQTIINFVPLIDGQDLQKAGLEPAQYFQDLLRTAIVKQMEGKTKEEIIAELLTAKKQG